MQKPASVSCSPLDYERPGAEAIPGVQRDGKYLVVRKSANISRFCFCCGRPGAGKPLLKHLWSGRNSPHGSSGHTGSSGGIVAIIELVGLLIELSLFVAWVFSEWSLSRRRTIVFGLCHQHRRQRRLKIAGAWLSLAIGTGLIAMGIATMGHLNGKVLYSSIASFIIGLTTWVVAVFLAANLPGPSLSRETAVEMWLKGAGKAMLDAQKPVAAK